MKKFLIFILSLILILILWTVWCLFYWPCNNKIKEIVPQKYHQYLEKFDFSSDNSENIEKNSKWVEMNINENKEKNSKENIENKAEKLENNNKEELKKEEKNLTWSLEENKNIENDNDKNINNTQEEKIQTWVIETSNEIKSENNKGLLNNNEIKEKLKKQIEEKTKESEKIENQEKINEIEKKKKEEYRKKLLNRLDIKENKEDLKKQKEIIIKENWVKKKKKVARYLWNWLYFTQDEENTKLYLKDKLLYSIENKTDFFDKESVDENPDLIDEKNVIRKEILKSFSLDRIWENVLLLKEKKWQDNKLYLIDLENKKFINLNKNFSHSIEKAKIAKKWIVFLVSKNFYEWWVYYINRNTKIVKTVFKNSDSSVSSDSFSYRKAYDFSVIKDISWESIVEVKYDWPRWNKLIKHIWF